MRYLVTASIRYLDGALAGILLHDGQKATFATRKAADTHARFLARVRDTNDFIRAVGTGAPYKVEGEVKVAKAPEVAPPDADREEDAGDDYEGEMNRRERAHHESLDAQERETELRDAQEEAGPGACLREDLPGACTRPYNAPGLAALGGCAKGPGHAGECAPADDLIPGTNLSSLSCRRTTRSSPLA